MIQKTYYDGNPEDRNFEQDFWSWLKHQPQDAWLLWLRNANYDSGDFIFEQMIDDPACDRAVAAWLFWSHGPGFYVEHPDEFQRRVDVPHHPKF